MDSVTRQAWHRLELLGEISDEPGMITREFGGAGMERASALLTQWMEEAGLLTERDAWGNVFGQTPVSGKPRIVLGSHFDTVRNAGRFDGAMGILAALACVERLKERWNDLPFQLEIAAFSDEEGLRFQSAYLGSRAAIGAISGDDLLRTDSRGITLGELIPSGHHDPLPRYTPESLQAYLEVHIEQGPVLENKNLPVGVVTHIAGQTRVRIQFHGRADHAGTCPMTLRKDALAGASSLVLTVEEIGRSVPGLVSTVGCLEVLNAASNVVPSEVTMTLDLRHADDEVRTAALGAIKNRMQEISEHRELNAEWEIVQESSSVACSPTITALLADSAHSVQGTNILLCSGAGHDAVILSRVAPMGMLFVRCKNGVSHHPEESVYFEDFAIAVQTLSEALIKWENAS